MNKCDCGDAPVFEWYRFVFTEVEHIQCPFSEWFHTRKMENDKRNDNLSNLYLKYMEMQIIYLNNIETTRYVYACVRPNEIFHIQRVLCTYVHLIVQWSNFSIGVYFEYVRIFLRSVLKLKKAIFNMKDWSQIQCAP